MSTSREHEGSNRARSGIPGDGGRIGSCSPKYACARDLTVQRCQVHALCLPRVSTRVATVPVPVFQKRGVKAVRVPLSTREHVT